MEVTVLLLVPLLALCLALTAALQSRHAKNRSRRRQSLYRNKTKGKQSAVSPPCHKRKRSRKKPDWVKHEIIRLKAHLPEYGCRKVRDAFNRIYQPHGMSISHDTVARIIRAHLYEIAQLRKIWKNRIPAPLAINHTWGLDATGRMDDAEKVHPILGILDHGPSMALAVLPLQTLTTIAILRIVFDTIERFGKPKIIRTDNASQFRSRLLRSAMVCLGIRQQFSDPGKPWMNGRVERFFWTLKERLNHLSVADFNGLNVALTEFKFWYNQVRPHQHLGGRTPWEARNGIDPYRQLPKDIRYVVGWDGLLTGFYSRY